MNEESPPPILEGAPLTRERPFWRSTKKLVGVIFLGNGLIMAWIAMLTGRAQEPVALVGLILGTGIALLGIKTAGGVLGSR